MTRIAVDENAFTYPMPMVIVGTVVVPCQTEWDSFKS